MVHSLSRKTFMTSRLAEFCTQSELVRLTGHAVDYWPRYFLKELVDNALDAAEEATSETQCSILRRRSSTALCPKKRHS